MPVQRLYIYRCGATNACALSDEKGDSRLPAPVAPDRWQFWMQTSRHPTEDGLHGFAMETAVTQIAARGYYLFTGSARLLDGRVTHSCDKKGSAVDLKTQTPFPVAIELASDTRTGNGHQINRNRPALPS